ncbi:hypothetical protein Tco_1293209 [Tanacetum coccineum]
MDDPSMTMEEYIKFEEEKARKRRKVFNYQTATYGKIRVDDDLHDLSSLEAEFPAIVINDAFAPHDTFQCKSQVSTPINDEFDFRISFDKSDDEDYTIICDTNSFSYKMIYVNNLKMDSENDYEKVMPLYPSPKSVISCFDDLDFFNDFENEFPAIVYNDAQTSKSDLLTEPILSPQHIDEFNDKTSLSEYDEEEQNVLYFNDLFPFNIICSDDLKSEKDNDTDKINIIQPFENNESTHGSNTLFETSHDKNTKAFRTGSFVINLNVKILIWIYYANGMLFYLIINLCAPFGIQFDPKRYYKDGVCAKMLRRPRYVLLCLTFRKISLQDMALPPHEQRHRFLRYEGLEYPDTDIVDFDGRLARIHMKEVHRVPIFYFGGLSDLMAEGLTTRMTMEHRDEAGAILDLDTPGTLQFQLGRARRHMSWRQFILALGLHMEEEMQTAGFDGMDVGSVNVPCLLARYLRLFAAGKKSGAYISEGQFVARLQISVEHDNTWAWVAMGPERQPDAAAGALANAEDAPIIDEGGQADPTPVQAPQQPPLPPPAPVRTIPQRLGILEEDVQGLRRDVGSLCGLVDISGVRHIFSRELARYIPEADQTEDWRGQHLHRTKPGRPREGNIDEYWWRIYKSGNLEVLES